MPQGIRRVEILQPLFPINVYLVYQPGFLHEGAPTPLGEMAILLVAAVLPRIDQAAEIWAFVALHIMAGHPEHVHADRQVTPRSRALRHFDAVASAYRLRYPDASFQKSAVGRARYSCGRKPESDAR